MRMYISFDVKFNNQYLKLLHERYVYETIVILLILHKFYFVQLHDNPEDQGSNLTGRCLIFGCSAKKQHHKKAVHIKAVIKKAVPDLAVTRRQHI